MLWKTRFVKLAAFSIGVGFGSMAVAQQAVKIEQPVKVIVPFSPGALIDLIARIYSDELSKKIGQPVVVENRPGAGGTVGTQRLLNEKPDSNTLLFVSSSYAVAPSVQKNLPYDTEKDLSGVIQIAYSPTLLVVNSKSPYKNLQDLITAGKKQDSHLNYGSAGMNSATDLVGRYFTQQTGTTITHIPYKGVQEGVSEVVAGRIDVSFPPIALALPFIKSGQLRALGVTSMERSESLPDVPTLHEQGVKDFDYAIWYGVIMNGRTDASVKAYFAQQLEEINKDPNVRKQLESQGLVPKSVQLTDFDKYISGEIKKFGSIVTPVP